MMPLLSSGRPQFSIRSLVIDLSRYGGRDDAWGGWKTMAPTCRAMAIPTAAEIPPLACHGVFGDSGFTKLDFRMITFISCVGAAKRAANAIVGNPFDLIAHAVRSDGDEIDPATRFVGRQMHDRNREQPALVGIQ